MRRALQAIQMKIDNSKVKENQVVFTVFNPSPYPRTEVVTAVLDLPADKDNKQYGVWDANTGNAIEFQEACRYEHPAVVRHLGDATMEMPSLRVHIHVPLKDVPALGYKTLIVKPKNTFKRPEGNLASARNTMENEFVKVFINPNGTLDMTHKESGRMLTGLHYFEDSGEAGHAWRQCTTCL